MNTLRPFALAVATLSLAACGAPGSQDGPLGTATEEQKVCLGSTTIEGIDVSHYDGTITWSSVKSSNIDFAFMKATEGTSFVDSQFSANWSGAKANGIVRGAYHFFHSNVDPTAQANHFLSVVGSIEAGDLPLVIDLEVDDGESASTVASTALTFLEAVEAGSGRTPIVYTGPSFFSSTLGDPPGFDKYPLWIANYGVSCPTVPDEWSSPTFWQDDDSATINGIGSACDHNFFNGSLGDLMTFVDGGSTSASSTAASSTAASSTAASTSASSSVAASSSTGDTGASTSTSVAASSSSSGDPTTTVSTSDAATSSGAGGDATTGAGGGSTKGNGVSNDGFGSAHSGCACEASSSSSNSPAWAASLAALAFVVSRRRRASR